MNIAIIGAGSTGLLLAAHLSNKHQITCYVRRPEQQKEISQRSIHLYPENERYSVHAELIDRIDVHDLYIICVKQPNLSDIIKTIYKNVPIDKPLLFLQNGMDHIAKLHDVKNPILIGVLDHGANRVNDYTVEHTGKGSIRIGAKNKEDKKLESLIKSLHSNTFPVFWENDWLRMVKKKLCVNAVINPLTALFNVVNGEIVANDNIRFLASKLCKEACEVLQLDEEEMWVYITEVAQKTKTNISSMRKDVIHHAKTEIDAISGYLVKVSQKEIPYTNFVYYAIKSLQTEREDY
ncbi:2-dehydropantoate 2-reductase [Salirhabdus euzebyi]|uniref:2-dehydropantoate 2-reductase n=1 Tax=Salirhabdus euzebyi TaxID=394506 RepID=A0A841Q9B8_9BACI|nr:2-dehydropantoate 2-reductase [Salirhabdus euzebyi]MBB6455018.1 2-dehydropantoate 2-reductase [Salirhabdus euzebyi]